MSEYDVAAVRRLLAIVGEMDADHVLDDEDMDKSALAALLHPDFELVMPFYNPEDPIIAGIADADGILRGNDAIARNLHEVTNRWAIKVSNPRTFDAGEVVLIRGEQNATGKETGRKSFSRFSEIFWVEDGRVRRIEAYMDTLAFKSLLP
jgi:ketosteroid isomerase-like protein